MLSRDWKNILFKSAPLLFLLICSFTVKQENQEIEEYNLKAAFIYNFTKYIVWNFEADGQEFVIGVIGNCPISNALTEIARTKTVNDKKIIIRQFDSPEKILACHILFIPKNNSFSLNGILAKASKGTLTISEKDGYALRGTAINFITVSNKLKFEANIKAIDSAGLTASSQLLKLAMIVE